MIWDLLSPRGCFVNNFVDRSRFDATEFTLHFQTVDDISNNIIACKVDPVYFKVNVAQVFLNLRVDPANSLKFGVQWTDNCTLT